ncbi:MAG: 30S ribosomal protein S6 [Pelagibacterales bacterium]|nr:30S ribosomal protein S6 [Pelagibacterales bacterium]OUU62245.1 MAG: 30S ribosomal protein S6 [Alphaproteobacteria bacterium TMED62]|tara:strand:- start:11086 stop:11469 length:384 start_codon:yes stop_codon:yes gene_type:complete
MQLYETIYIVKQDLDSKALKDLEEKYDSLLKLNKAIVEYKENWGLRNLAYKIKNYKKGYYYMVVFNGEKESVNELERNFRIDENIIRFLTSKADNIPSEPSPIMKYKIEKENAENYVNEASLESNES